MPSETETDDDGLQEPEEITYFLRRPGEILLRGDQV